MRRLFRPFLASGNWLMSWLLRSPFHWLFSGSVLLLEIRGRRTGKLYLVAVNYRRSEGVISVMTYRRRGWWRNLVAANCLYVHLKGRRQRVRVELVTDDFEAIARALRERGWLRRVCVRASARFIVLIRLRPDT